MPSPYPVGGVTAGASSKLTLWTLVSGSFPQARQPFHRGRVSWPLHSGQFLTVYILFSLYLENSTSSLRKVELSIEGASSGSGGRGGGGSKGWLWGGQVITKLLCGCEC